MKSEYMRLYRARKKAEGGLRKGDPRHGTVNGYDNYGCRCTPCTAAAASKMANWRAQTYDTRAGTRSGNVRAD